MWKIQLFKLNYDEREMLAVRNVLESGWITMGQHTIEFEAAFAKRLGHEAQCAAVANGTAALHIAALAIGVGPGDEVVVPSLTFIADLNAIVMCGADVVLADVTSESDWAMSPAEIERRIGPKTKAVLIVHFAGYACDMDAIAEICERRKVALIEDCAHAPGADYKGRPLGTFGAISAWSFFSNKNIAVGEGGMVVARDPAIFQKCKNLRSHGMTVASYDRYQGRTISYDVLEPGLNYRIDEMRAAIGLIQLEKLIVANARRKALTLRYFKRLSGQAGFTIPFLDFTRGEPSYHIMPVLLDARINRLKVIQSMTDDEIQSSIHYPPIQGFTAYKGRVNATPITEAICARELTLPLYPTMSDAEVDMVCESFLRAITRGSE